MDKGEAMTNTCPCSRPTDLFLCSECVKSLSNDLRGVPDLINELRTTGAKLDVTGSRGGGGSSERPMGVNVGALEVKGTLEHLLLSIWMRVGLPVSKISPIEYVEGIIPRIHILAAHKSATSYRDQLKAEIKRAEELIDTPKEVMRLGDCTTPECGTSITALMGHEITRCQTCGETYNVQETRATQKLGALRHIHNKTGTPAQIGRIFRELGVPIPTNTIYWWVHNEELSAVGKNLKGRDVYVIGQIIDLKLEKLRKVA